MADRVAKGLNVLADGLRHYVVARVPAQVLSNSAAIQGNVQDWDALALLVFMWDHWNDLFRHDLSFVERSLISELREYRNRWAHQQKFSEGEIYRIMDNIERLLTALESGQVAAIRRLRLESLRLLFNQEIGGRDSGGFLYKAWPWVMCGASALAMDSASLAFGRFPWSWIMAFLVFIAMMRVAWWQTIRETLHRRGPHECGICGCIIYTERCPYCQPATAESAAGAVPPRRAGGSRWGTAPEKTTVPGRS
ncbi:MAG: Swt1 family HEPN domain-containing protein [Planctomyces sp.]